MRKINEIIIHCSATRPEWFNGKTTSQKVAEIKKWHVRDNGWKDIGYHYLIDRDGTVAKGRDDKVVGAHTSGHNSYSLGICLIGGFGSNEKDKFSKNFTKEQDKALRKLINKLISDYDIKLVSGHNNYAAKACPGFNAKSWFKDEVVEVVNDTKQPSSWYNIVSYIFSGLAKLIKNP